MLLDLSFQYRGGDKVCKPNLVSSNLSSYFDYSRNFGSGNFTAYFYDFQPSLKGALWITQKNRQMDMAIMDVCFYNRGFDILVALSDFPST